MTETTTSLRSQVPVEQTWNLDSIFATPADWDATCQQVQALLPRLSAFQGRLKDGPPVLLECLQLVQEAGTLMGKIGTYAGNAHSVDTLDQSAAARAGQSRSLGARYGAAIAFFDPELMAIGFDRLRQWIRESPELAFMAHYVDRLENARQHVRSGEVEEVLALTGDPFAGPSSIYGALNSADLAFQPAVATDGTRMEVGQASIGSLITHADREVRRTAWQNYADGYLAFKNTYAATLTAAIKQDVFNMRARVSVCPAGLARAEQHAGGSLSQPDRRCSRSTCQPGTATGGCARKPWASKAFDVYDIKAPITSAKPVVPFQQAVKWICRGYGADGRGVRRASCAAAAWKSAGWIGPATRASAKAPFPAARVGTRPFIMMSYSDDLFSLSTLAHELGHSLHSYYTRQTQPYLYSRYSLFVAEVASELQPGHGAGLSLPHPDRIATSRWR